MNNDTHWLSRYHRQSSSSYGRESGWSETKGVTRLTPFGAILVISVCVLIGSLIACSLI